MSYSTKRGRPFEQASKSSHTHIIKDESVQKFLEECNLPKESKDVELNNKLLLKPDEIDNNPIEHIIAIDGGISTVPVKTTFPSSTITFFQFGALSFNLSDLESLSKKPFVSPDDISKLKELERIKLVLPTKNLSLKGEKNLIYSVRKTLYDFFAKDREGESFIETLHWFIFKEYEKTLDSYQLANCPSCGDSKLKIEKKKIAKDFTAICPSCSGVIFLTDFFRLHEAIDNELGAGGIIGYVVNLVEQMILVHTIRIILKLQPALLKRILFIKDGPLAFFGQTANMHKPMRDLTNYLFKNHDLFLAGLEKSGAFVEHADEITEKLKFGTVLLLDNKHIYTYILPGNPDTQEPYAKTSYYGSKLIFKSATGGMYVVTLPTTNEEVVLKPQKDDFKNLDVIVHNIAKLKCDMYDSALLPIALANKLVSLSNHPSSVLLRKFAKEKVH